MTGKGLPLPDRPAFHPCEQDCIRGARSRGRTFDRLTSVSDHQVVQEIEADQERRAQEWSPYATDEDAPFQGGFHQPAVANPSSA